MARQRSLFHGGISGMKPGDIVRPDQAHRKHVDGCPICEARAAGQAHVLLTPAGWVYATNDRSYARYYAAIVSGDLYRVQLAGGVERSVEDSFPSWRGRKARVLSVAERKVVLSPLEIERLWDRWGIGDETRHSNRETIG